MCWDRHPFVRQGWWSERRRSGSLRLTAPTLPAALDGDARLELITPLDELVAALENLAAAEQAVARPATGRHADPRMVQAVRASR